MKIERISWSQINMLGKCGEQYRRRYVEGEVLPPGIAQLRGRAVHKPIEQNMAHKLTTGALLPLEEVRDLAAFAVDAELAGEYVLDGEYEGLKLTEASGLVKDEVVALAGLHATDVAPTVEPKAVEVKIEVPPSNVLPVTLVGVLDLVDAEGVRDTKTARKSPPENAAHDSDQLTMYDLLHRARYRAEPGRLRLDYLVRTPKRGELKVRPLDTHRTTDDLEVFVRRVRAAVRSVEAEVFLPAPQDHWACSTRFCGYASTCSYFRGRARPTT